MTAAPAAGIASLGQRRAEFLPFSRPSIGEAEIAEVVDSLKSGWITTGPKTARFETEFAAACQVPHALSLASATAGLHLAMLALGIKPGDEIITPSMTFVAAVNMIVMAGATPVFVDVDPKSLNIDPALIAAKITKRTRAILPVHFAGLPCDMDAVNAIAREHGLTVIEDAAHAVGASYRGKPIGSLSDLAIFSFHPIKNLTTGEGGMITTCSAELTEKLKLLRFHGMDKDAWKRYRSEGSPHYEVITPGFKYNMMDLQASLGLHQLRRLPELNAIRTKLAVHYDRLLSDVPEIEAPATGAGYPAVHAWHLYVPKVRLERLTIDRDTFMQKLKEENIGTGLHFKGAHLHAFYREHYSQVPGSLAHTEWASDRIMSLPLFADMTLSDVEDVVQAIRRVVVRHRR